MYIRILSEACAAEVSECLLLALSGNAKQGVKAFANTPGADKERLKTGQSHGFSVLGVPYSPISGAMVVAYDPVANENAKALLGNVRVLYSATLSGTLINADGAVILTEWDEFRKAEWRDLASLMANPLLVDLRNLFSLQEARCFGIKYISLGRRPVAISMQAESVAVKDMSLIDSLVAVHSEEISICEYL